MSKRASVILEYLQRTFQVREFPVSEVPTWAPKVDRWNQLDPPAFALVQAVSQWRVRTDRALLAPTLIVLASPGASNATDRAFVRTGATSPSRFAHTLPNTRGTALLQSLDWSGPLICLQKGPATLASGLVEGIHALDSPGRDAAEGAIHSESSTASPVWVLGVTSASAEIRVSGFFLAREPAIAITARPGRDAHSSLFRVERMNFASNTDTPARTDLELTHWLQHPDAQRLPLRLDDRLRLEAISPAKE